MRQRLPQAAAQGARRAGARRAPQSPGARLEVVLVRAGAALHVARVVPRHAHAVQRVLHACALPRGLDPAGRVCWARRGGVSLAGRVCWARRRGVSPAGRAGPPAAVPGVTQQPRANGASVGANPIARGRTRVLSAKGQLIDDVAGVELGRLEGDEVVHMHAALLERLAWRDVHIAGNLRGATAPGKRPPTLYPDPLATRCRQRETRAAAIRAAALTGRPGRQGRAGPNARSCSLPTRARAAAAVARACCQPAHPAPRRTVHARNLAAGGA